MDCTPHLDIIFIIIYYVWPVTGTKEELSRSRIQTLRMVIPYRYRTLTNGIESKIGLAILGTVCEAQGYWSTTRLCWFIPVIGIKDLGTGCSIPRCPIKWYYLQESLNPEYMAWFALFAAKWPRPRDIVANALLSMLNGSNTRTWIVEAM